MEISPIALFRSPLKSKFGVPRQSGLAPSLRGVVELLGEWADTDAVRGLEEFDYVWLVWAFSENVSSKKHAMVRPPRLGGNKRIGVFATRSSFRPNNLAISSVKLERIYTESSKTRIEVSGADLMDGTPIYDIKPYIPEFDAHADAKGGFTDTVNWQSLEVDIPSELRSQLNQADITSIVELLSEDPRPHYHTSTERVYGMRYKDMDVKFNVTGNYLKITGIDLI